MDKLLGHHQFGWNNMNLIYIHTHDSGTLTGAYGYGNDDSKIKQFAQDALLFRKAFTVNPTCSPSRASLLTGLYPHQNGMLGLANRGFKLNDYDDHLVNILKRNGYHTALCGIQHEAGRYVDHGLGAEIIGYDDNLSVDFDMSSEEKLSEWDRLNTDFTVDWIRNYSQDKPLFLSFGLFSTHRPFPVIQPQTNDNKYTTPPMFLPDEEAIRDDYTKYLDSLAIADTCFGAIIDALKESGLYDNSLIVFTTDHGIAMPFAKCNLSDQGIGVSFIMRHPEMKRKGLVTESLISQVDFVPTVIELLDLDHDKKLSGVSFAPLFDDESLKVREDIFASINFHTSYEPMRAVRTDRYKYIRYFDSYKGMNLSNIDNSGTKDFYLEHEIAKRTKDEENLFDLLYDPTERNNLVLDPTLAHVVEEMRQRLHTYMLETNDPLLDGPIEVSKDWKVNKTSSIIASSKDPDDYV